MICVNNSLIESNEFEIGGGGESKISVGACLEKGIFPKSHMIYSLEQPSGGGGGGVWYDNRARFLEKA